MATITGLTAERMLEIEAASVIDGDVVAGNLILSKHDGSQINAGSVVGPAGPIGPPGVAIVAIPGEVRMWPSLVLPDLIKYGKWAWANGDPFDIAAYPEAAANIDDVWNTAMGVAAPPAGQFRVPDLRGLVPACLDAMPNGSPRANRLTRADAIVLAKNTGKEVHAMAMAEMPAHSHRSDGAGGAGGLVASGGVAHTHSGTTSGRTVAHKHGMSQSRSSYTFGTSGIGAIIVEIIGRGGQYNTGVDMDTESADHAHNFTTGGASAYNHQHGINTAGGGSGHENVQPTVFVPYIVKLDDT